MYKKLKDKSDHTCQKAELGGQWYIYEKFSVFHSMRLLCNSMFAWKKF